MMNKLLAFLVLAASPLFAVQADCNDINKSAHLTHYGYFYTTTEQVIDVYDDVNGYYPILFNPDFGVATREVYLNSDNAGIVVLDDVGVYLITYSVIATIPESHTNIEFALTLNGELIAGSVYGAIGIATDTYQVFGQIIVNNYWINASIELVNYSSADVTLANPFGSEDLTFTTASMLVEKLNKLRD